MNIYLVYSNLRCEEYNGFVVAADDIEECLQIVRDGLSYSSEKEKFTTNNTEVTLISTECLHQKGIILSEPIRTDW